MSRTPTTALALVEGTSIAPAVTMNPVKATQVADNLNSLLTFLFILLTPTKQEDGTHILRPPPKCLGRANGQKTMQPWTTAATVKINKKLSNCLIYK
jgi:hypothetical protein